MSGVIRQKLYKPTDLLKSKLREEFAIREQKMQNIDSFISQTLDHFTHQMDHTNNSENTPQKCGDRKRNESLNGDVSTGKHFL